MPKKRPGLFLFAALLCAFSGLLLVSRLAQRQVPWLAGGFQRQEEAHFVFYYHQTAFLKWLAPQAEDALQYDLAFYGMTAEPFSTPSGKITIYLCDSQQEYLRRSPSPRAWEAGSALPRERQIFLWMPPGDDRLELQRVVAHEISHLCYHQLLPDIDQDDWLNEGLADYLGYHFLFEHSQADFRSWMQTNFFASLKTQRLGFESFVSSTPRAFGNDEGKVTLFYTQGFSVVFMLIEYFGKAPFLDFLKEYSRGKSIEAALAKVYPKISNMQDLEGNWLLYMAS